ncbi:hypothetical protein [Bifidobacterium breve]|uniref:hypothetical protein n=1 Tax=Bifidobacterium breve TaxID=1685 RepID=UPI0012B56764|nr:hypothetical protein [Bifidobacterium breve]
MMFIICIIMKWISPNEWLEQVIYGWTGQAPMVHYQQNTPSRGSYIVSLTINAAGMREQVLGDRIIIHVNSAAHVQARVAAADAVRKALFQIERETRHVYPGYSYFKIKALQQTTCPSLKCLNGYHHHMNRPLYVTTTYVLFLVFVF